MEFLYRCFLFFLQQFYILHFTTKEYPPSQSVEEAAEEKHAKGLFSEIMSALANMPSKNEDRGIGAILTWPGLFLMWFYYTTAVATNIYGGTSNADPVQYAKAPTLQV